MKEVWLLRDGDVLASTAVAQGLMACPRALFDRSGGDGAILFSGARSAHTAGVRTAVDAAFLDGDLVVLATVRLDPWRVALPRRGTRSILEASAGTFERWGLRRGHRLEIRDPSC